MRNPHQIGSSVLVSVVLYLSLLISGPPPHVNAQQPTRLTVTERGIQLYQQGDATEAIKILNEVVKKYPDDADAWYYLGLAFNSQNEFGASRSPFEHLIHLRPNSADAHAKLAYALILANEPQKAIAMAQRAIELGDESPEAHYAIAEGSLRTGGATTTTSLLEKAVEEAETALRINPNFAPALITKSFAHFRLKQHAKAVTSLEGYLGIRPDDVDAETWRGQREEMLERVAQSTTTQSAGEATTFTGKMVTQKARVVSKPEPQYTESARKAGVEGTVVLRTIFASDGEVKDVFVVQALGYGLTTEAIRAARQIKFQPAVKDGRPVSMYIQLEYNFNLY
ncbi:MAG: TonB family protein [Acidobacteriota bacterium]